MTATKRVDSVADGEHMGVYADPYVDQLTRGVEGLFGEVGVTSLVGEVRFVDDDRVVVTGPDAYAVAFDHCAVATGSRPRTVPGFAFDADPVWDAAQALAAERLPKRLVVVGGGYIGMELATVFARLGTDVTVLEMFDEPLPGFPARLTARSPNGWMASTPKSGAASGRPGGTTTAVSSSAPTPATTAVTACWSRSGASR